MVQLAFPLSTGLITLTQRWNSLMEVCRVWPCRICPIYSLVLKRYQFSWWRTNLQCQRDFFEYNYLPSLTTDGTEGARKLLRVVCMRVHLAPVSTGAVIFLFISGELVNSDPNTRPLIASNGPHLEEVLACILYVGQGRHPLRTGLYS